MIIRKLFKYEMSHRVLGAYTRRCSGNIHGHSYKLELLFDSNKPDGAQMVMDFGFVKKYMHPFVDSFDHAHALWDNLEEPFATQKTNIAENNYICDVNERYILLPFSSTAEMQAKMFYTFAKHAVDELVFMDLIEGSVYANSAIVHETDTGYAVFRKEDESTCKFPEVDLTKIKFSQTIINEWPAEFRRMYNNILEKIECGKKRYGK